MYVSFSPAESTKALGKPNIVHRDLKPGNTFIKHHPHTKKMQVRESVSLS
jgi:serine/threonine protein kinase